MEKMLRQELLTPVKTPHLPVLPLCLTQPKLRLPPVRLHKIFST